MLELLPLPGVQNSATELVFVSCLLHVRAVQAPELQHEHHLRIRNTDSQPQLRFTELEILEAGPATCFRSPPGAQNSAPLPSSILLWLVIPRRNKFCFATWTHSFPPGPQWCMSFQRATAPFGWIQLFLCNFDPHPVTCSKHKTNGWRNTSQSQGQQEDSKFELEHLCKSLFACTLFSHLKDHDQIFLLVIMKNSP